MPFKIVRNDITKMPVDVIVDASNPNPIVGGGVDRAINLAAGTELIAARKEVGCINRGEAYITPGFKLPSEYVIHTVGPVWQGGQDCEISKLENCYKNSLQLAVNSGCESIAFPLISSGAFGVPYDIALEVAVRVMSEFSLRHDIMIYLVVFDKNSFSISQKLFNDIESYIDENYVDEHFYKRGYDNRSDFDDRVFLSLSKDSIADQSEVNFDKDDYLEDLIYILKSHSVKNKENTLESALENLDISFSQALIKIIDAKELPDPVVYKKANIDRKLFSKIKNNIHYKPAKYTAIAFAIALELNREETDALLEKAGYVLSKSNKADVIISYFIENKNYNIFEINEVLFYYDQPLIGG